MPHDAVQSAVAWQQLADIGLVVAEVGSFALFYVYVAFLHAYRAVNGQVELIPQIGGKVIFGVDDAVEDLVAVAQAAKSVNVIFHIFGFVIIIRQLYAVGNTYRTIWHKLTSFIIYPNCRADTQEIIRCNFMPTAIF